MELHKKQEEICKSLGDQAGLIVCYWNTGSLLEEMGKPSEAVEKYKIAVELEEKLKHPDLEKDRKYLEELIRKLEEEEKAE